MQRRHTRSTELRNGVYLGPWYYVLVLVAWPAASLTLGFLAFRRSELTA
jgi:hypothetical protein